MPTPLALVGCLLAALALPTPTLVAPPAPGPASPPSATRLALDDAADRVAYIDGLHSRQLHDLLATEADAFLAEHPDHRDADVVRYRLASACLALSRHEDAARQFRVLAGRPGFGWRAESSLRLGQCELALGDIPAAVAALGDARRLGDADLKLPASFLLAEAYVRAEDFGAALPLFDDVLRRDPGGAFATDAASGRAWCCHRLGQHSEALASCDGLLSAAPDAELSRELQFLRGESLLALNRPSDAATAYAQVTEGPFADAALRGEGFARAAAGDHGGAAARFEHLVKLHRDSRFSSEAAFQAGVQRLLAGDAPGALAALSSPRVEVNAETRYWRARAAAEAGQTETALQLLSEAESLGPDANLRAHLASTRGNLLAASGRSAEAAAAYARGGSPGALHAAAVASLNAGDAEGALKLCDASLAAGGDEPALRLTRGEALFALDRNAEARADFQAALSDADPGRSLRARSRLAWCFYRDGNLPAAQQGFASLRRQHPATNEAEEAWFMEGRCLDERGQSDAAAECWAAYLDAHGQSERATEARLALGRLLTPHERLAHLQAAADSAPLPDQRAAALLLLADSQVELGRSADAEASYGRIIQQYGASVHAPAARYGLGWLLVDRGQPAAALNVLAPVLGAPARGEPVPAAELVSSAHELAVWCHVQAGDATAAERALTALAQLSPAPERLLAAGRNVAQAHTAAGNDRAAQRVLDALAGTSSVARVEAGWIALDAGRLDEAESRARAAAQASADDASAELLFFVAEARFEQGRDDLAIPLYEACAATPGPLTDESLYKAGFARLRAGDPEGARKAFDALVASTPGSPLVGESLFLAGEAAFQQGQWQVCADRCERLLREQPGHAVAAKARFRQGLALAQLERWQPAADTLAELARRHAGFENLLEAELWRGRALAAVGNERGARSALERVVAEDGGALSARARIELGRLHQRSGEHERALSEFLKVVVLHGPGAESSEALLLSGDCLLALDRADAAAARWQELIDQDPHSPFAQTARLRLKGV